MVRHHLTAAALALALPGCLPSEHDAPDVPRHHRVPSMQFDSAGVPSMGAPSMDAPSLNAPSFFPANCRCQPPSEDLQRHYQRAGLKYGLVGACELACQGKCESGWRVNVVSSTGDVGVAQFQPATAAELGVDPLDPAQAIDGQGRYLDWSKRRWTPPDFEGRTAADLDALGYATYNRGVGTIRRDQREHGWALPREGVANWPRATQHYIACITGDPSWVVSSSPQ